VRTELRAAAARRSRGGGLEDRQARTEQGSGRGPSRDGTAPRRSSERQTASRSWLARGRATRLRPSGLRCGQAAGPLRWARRGGPEASTRVRPRRAKQSSPGPPSAIAGDSGCPALRETPGPEQRILSCSAPRSLTKIEPEERLEFGASSAAEALETGTGSLA